MVLFNTNLGQAQVKELADEDGLKRLDILIVSLKNISVKSGLCGSILSIDNTCLCIYYYMFFKI